MMGGLFVVECCFGYWDGIMGGNFWFMGLIEDVVIEVVECVVIVVDQMFGMIMIFLGGIVFSVLKVGSKYKFFFVSIYEKFCLIFCDQLGDKSGVLEGVNFIMEIIINGSVFEMVCDVMYVVIKVVKLIFGLFCILVGNYGGRFGNSFIYLIEEVEVSVVC